MGNKHLPPNYGDAAYAKPRKSPLAALSFLVSLVALGLAVYGVFFKSGSVFNGGSQEGEFTYRMSKIDDREGWVITGVLVERDEITLPSEHDGLPVLSVGPNLFLAINVKKIKVPASVLYLQTNAFANMTATEIEFANGSQLKGVGDYAFSGSKALRKITLPPSCEFIGDYAFMDCIMLTEAKLERGSKLNRVGHGAFSGCIALTTLYVSATISEVMGKETDSSGVSSGDSMAATMEPDLDEYGYRTELGDEQYYALRGVRMLFDRAMNVKDVYLVGLDDGGNEREVKNLKNLFNFLIEAYSFMPNGITIHLTQIQFSVLSAYARETFLDPYSYFYDRTEYRSNFFDQYFDMV